MVRLMRVLVLALAAVSGLFAADTQQLALALKAQSDFDKVQLSAVPQLADASNCVLSQAALISVGLPE